MTCDRTRFEADLASVDDVRSCLAPVADQAESRVLLIGHRTVVFAGH